MPKWRLQAAAWADTTFPTDACIINPCFDDHGATTDPDGLCEDLATALSTYYAGTRQITVKAYDLEGTKPVFPAGEHTLNAGQAPASTRVRETALCLSFYAGQNRPRQRGRLYVPCALTNITATAARPVAGEQQKVADLVPILAGLGGLDVDWIVWSQVDHQARKVTNWWVDNAWDTMRSRGVAPTSRLEGTTGG